MIVHRTEMRETIARILSKLTGRALAPADTQPSDEPAEGDDAPLTIAAGDE